MAIDFIYDKLITYFLVLILKRPLYFPCAAAYTWTPLRQEQPLCRTFLLISHKVYDVTLGRDTNYYYPCIAYTLPRGRSREHAWVL